MNPEREVVRCAVIIMAGALFGAGAGVLAAWRLSQPLPDHAALGSLLGAGGVVLGMLIGWAFAALWQRRQHGP